MSDKIHIKFNFKYAQLDLFINGQIQTFKLPNKTPYPTEAFLDETIRTFKQILECNNIKMSEHSIINHISEAYTRYNQNKDEDQYIEIEVTVNPKEPEK